MSATRIVFDLIANERQRQLDKWGPGNIVNRSRLDALAVLMEEVGEAAHAHLEGDVAEYEREMVQVAAVAVAALEASMRDAFAGERVPGLRPLSQPEGT